MKLLKHIAALLPTAYTFIYIYINMYVHMDIAISYLSLGQIIMSNIKYNLKFF